jgi:hypothetical protein
MSKYDKSDAARDTNSSIKEVSAAHHQARDDSGVREGKDTKIDSAPSWAPKEAGGVSTVPDRAR